MGSQPQRASEAVTVAACYQPLTEWNR